MFQNPFSNYQLPNYSQQFQQLQRNYQQNQRNMEVMGFKSVQQSKEMIEAMTRSRNINILRAQGKYAEARSLESMYNSLDQSKQKNEWLSKIAEFLVEQGLRHFEN